MLIQDTRLLVWFSVALDPWKTLELNFKFNFPQSSRTGGKLAETLSQEAIWHQVPILGVPLLYEQKLTAQLIKKNNLGRVVDFDNFDQARANSQFCQRCL